MFRKMSIGNVRSIWCRTRQTFFYLIQPESAQRCVLSHHNNYLFPRWQHGFH